MFASNNEIYAWQASSDECIETLQLINYRKLEPQVSILPNSQWLHQIIQFTHCARLLFKPNGTSPNESLTFCWTQPYSLDSSIANYGWCAALHLRWLLYFLVSIVLVSAHWLVYTCTYLSLFFHCILLVPWKNRNWLASAPVIRSLGGKWLVWIGMQLHLWSVKNIESSHMWPNHCCGQVISQPCKMNYVKPQILYSILLHAKHRILQAQKFHWKF